MGERFAIWDQLEAVGLQPRVHHLVANCDICGTRNVGIQTARTTPVGSTWMGGKEAYQTCCPNCFEANSVFHNLNLVLADPGWYDTNKTKLLRLTGLT